MLVDTRCLGFAKECIVNILDLPFNKYVGLSISEYEGAEVVCLAPKAHHENHVQTIHASALFALAEASSGHALLSISQLDATKVFAVVRKSNIKFRQPATSLTFGLANLEPSVEEKLIEDLAAKGRALITVPVILRTVDGQEACQADFTWFVTWIAETTPR